MATKELWKEALGGRQVDIGIISGSGLSSLCEILEDAVSVRYSDIPGFPIVTAPDHIGELVLGRVGAIRCAVLRGRFHFYEGHNMAAVTAPVDLLRHLGTKVLILTNACGGINQSYRLGDIAVIGDHIGLPTLCGNHPLMGVNHAMNTRARQEIVYDLRLQEILWMASTATNLSATIRKDAIYSYLSGPYYQTFAECRFLKSMGVDVVGMSSVPEALTARNGAMRVAALSLVCSQEATCREEVSMEEMEHEAFMAIVRASSQDLQRLLRTAIESPAMAALLADTEVTTSSDLCPRWIADATSPSRANEGIIALSSAKKQTASVGFGAGTESFALALAAGALAGWALASCMRRLRGD